ncbi:MAG: phosphatase PAP2 family protein [Candidatus Uhrbacteria bacterium]|nr:phosphatase PAP2 family protein [Candidatus Uhrbacteria bacterium]
MKHVDLKITTVLERWGEAHLSALWRFGAAYALGWFVLEAFGFLFVMPITKWVFFLGSAMAIYFLTLVIQLIVRRARPVHHRAQPFRLGVHTFSFPSAHSSTSFGCAVLGSAAALAYAPELAGVLITLNFFVAAFIAVSRVFVGVHFVGDVIVGALLGTLAGMLFAGVL